MGRELGNDFSNGYVYSKLYRNCKAEATTGAGSPTNENRQKALKDKK
jgi:hypothetical protein